MTSTPELDAALSRVDADAAEGARRGRLTDAAIAALKAAGLFKLFLPADIGGGARSLPDACRDIAAVARADGAAGWAVMIGAGPNWFAGHMGADLAQRVFGPPDSSVAGSGLPGSATPRADGGPGWMVSGTWRWCSGSPWATWFTFGVQADGSRDSFVVAVPAEQVFVDPESWSAVGLRATASWDSRLDGAAVPADATFVIDEARPVRPEPIFRIPFRLFAEATMAAVTAGLAQRLLVELGALLRGKVAYGADQPLAADPVVSDQFARLAGAVRAASTEYEHRLEPVWVEATNGAVSADAARDLRLAALHLVSTGAEAARSAWDLAGMTALAGDAPLTRVIADLQAVPQNTVVAPARFAEVGAELLGRKGGDA